MNPDPAVAAKLIDQGAGRCALAGDLTLATADRLWNQLHATGLLHTATHVDANQLAKSDSAGLALLIAWRAVRRKDGGDLAITSLPGRLKALAHLTDAEEIVSG
jgi:phospholipid transport system transporter-binding protein